LDIDIGIADIDPKIQDASSKFDTVALWLTLADVRFHRLSAISQDDHQ
jgi:hypothetical protein